MFRNKTHWLVIKRTFAVLEKNYLWVGERETVRTFEIEITGTLNAGEIEENVRKSVENPPSGSTCDRTASGPWNPNWTVHLLGYSFLRAKAHSFSFENPSLLLLTALKSKRHLMALSKEIYKSASCLNWCFRLFKLRPLCKVCSGLFEKVSNNPLSSFFQLFL